jgi:glutathione S-transferase
MKKADILRCFARSAKSIDLIDIAVRKENAVQLHVGNTSMIKLYQFNPAWGLPNPSPFCMKVETYLRMVGLPYEVVNGAMPFKAPKRKLPYIEDGVQVVADSGLIIEYGKRYGDKLDQNLSAPEKATAHMLRRTFEDSLYWVGLYSRWIENSIWLETRRLFFDAIPPIMRELAAGTVRRGMRKALYAQGTGRHSRDEIYEIGKADLSAISTWLGEKTFFMGAAPTSLDAIAYSFLANILYFTELSEDHAMSLPNLSAYCERMKEQYYKE